MFSLQKLLQNSFNSIINYFIKRKVNDLIQSHYIAHLVDAFKGIISFHLVSFFFCIFLNNFN
jgi:hypothetical protein